MFWQCATCHTENPQTESICEVCGASRTESGITRTEYVKDKSDTPSIVFVVDERGTTRIEATKDKSTSDIPSDRLRTSFDSVKVDTSTSKPSTLKIPKPIPEPASPKTTSKSSATIRKTDTPWWYGPWQIARVAINWTMLVAFTGSVGLTGLVSFSATHNLITPEQNPQSPLAIVALLIGVFVSYMWIRIRQKNECLSTVKEHVVGLPRDLALLLFAVIAAVGCGLTIIYSLVGDNDPISYSIIGINTTAALVITFMSIKRDLSPRKSLNSTITGAIVFLSSLSILIVLVVLVIPWTMSQLTIATVNSLRTWPEENAIWLFHVFPRAYFPEGVVLTGYSVVTLSIIYAFGGRIPRRIVLVIIASLAVGILGHLAFNVDEVELNLVMTASIMMGASFGAYWQLSSVDEIGESSRIRSIIKFAPIVVVIALAIFLLIEQSLLQLVPLPNHPLINLSSSEVYQVQAGNQAEPNPVVVVGLTTPTPTVMFIPSATPVPTSTLVNDLDLTYGTRVTGRVTSSSGDRWTFFGQQNDEVVIYLYATSDDFDTYLVLLDSEGETIREDDDGGIGYNSELSIRLSATGQYTIIAQGFNGGV